jgi:hypothetical protein
VICDEIKKRHGNFVMDQGISCNACSAAFSSRFRCVLVPRTSSTQVAMWSWPTWVVESGTCFG